MDALISQSTHYTQFIYEPNLIVKNLLLNHNKVTHSENQEKINHLQTNYRDKAYLNFEKALWIKFSL